MIQVDNQYLSKFFCPHDWGTIQCQLHEAHNLLESGLGKGSEFTGWINPMVNKAEYTLIKKAASQICETSEVLLVIGIGGSYLGARAALEFILSPNYNLKIKQTPDIYFIGNNLSSRYINEIIDLVGDKDFAINVISKSGTTLEPAIGFQIFKDKLIEKYGVAEARTRIYVTTDASAGELKVLADQEGFLTLKIPDNIGGRYSVLTAVGLLPIAVAGIDIQKILKSAYQAKLDLSEKSMNNPAWQYAAARNLLYKSGKKIEILAFYEPCLRFFGEWWKQLFGESEGKNGFGIFPATVEYTADLHSMGQYIQEGERHLFETVIKIEDDASPVYLKSTDSLEYLAGRSLSYINEQAMKATLLAHTDGGVPNVVIKLERICAESFGYMIYFFELACALSGYLLDVNPFNQPGVEAYKKIMFSLLGKPEK